MNCDDCWYNSYDEEQDAYYCSRYFDEDEMERLLRLGGRCPYFRSGSEYDVARKQ